LNLKQPAGRLLHCFNNCINKFRCRIEHADGVCLAYNPGHTIFIREYYLYVVDLFRQSCRAAGPAINLIFGNYEVRFKNGHKRFKLDIQFEHTLVKPGGRDSAGAVAGTIPIMDGPGNYLVRIQNYNYLNTLDLVIDYSLPNLINVKTCGAFDDYSAKTIHVSPLIHEVDFGSAERSGNIVALFGDVHQPRRKSFLEKAMESGLPLKNVKGVFRQDELRRLYKNTKILVNVHQTGEHHTLEELRILPALLSGVIVVSEDVPLKEHIPYARFIVWSNYENMIDTVRRVHDNYDRHYRRIFGDPELAGVLAQMKRDNIEHVAAALSRLRVTTI
jgi:hypothetical protein